MIPITAVLITREAHWRAGANLGTFPFAEIMCQTQCPNVLQRFELAQQAQHDIIYVQDDDVTINIAELWSHYDGRLTNAITAERQRRYAGTGVTLMGWGSFWPKSMLNFTRWTARYGPLDPMYVDYIFTYLNQPHNTHVMRIHELPRHGRMISCQPGHNQKVNEMITMLHTL